ncbi:hypothetical protein DJ017_09725 [Phenylobacterium soli]|uniref:Uncharacterized protein n=1 Tax=Phenylobacterium soli TaxID=2170551 RepID=A0A328AMY8_9CAUL|nr:hypothetical protein DJ017_09725 [Phenylobacterium soli]
MVHSSAAAFSHFGLTLEPLPVEKPTVGAERVVARSHAAAPAPQKIADCPIRRVRPAVDAKV